MSTIDVVSHRQFGAASTRVPYRGGDRSRTVVDMTSEEIADLVHLRRSRDLMDRDYAQPLDVPAMARAAFMSPAHVSRKFRAAYGETPYSCLMTRRIERAKARLRRGMSVTGPQHRDPEAPADGVQRRLRHGEELVGVLHHRRESQRMINETYSTFVQGSMPTLARPDVDVLEGLTTAIIVDQERMGADARSTVGNGRRSHSRGRCGRTSRP